MLGLVISTKRRAHAGQRARARHPGDGGARRHPPGEIDGEDAGFLAICEMLPGTEPPAASGSSCSSSCRSSMWTATSVSAATTARTRSARREMGRRVTPQNFNLNRDYTKADAPEMQSMLKLLDAWDPVLYVDLHVTDGAQFEPDVANNLEPVLTAAIRHAAHGSRAGEGAQPGRWHPRARSRSTSIRRSICGRRSVVRFRGERVSAALLPLGTGRPAIAIRCSSRPIRGRTIRRGFASRAISS